MNCWFEILLNTFPMNISTVGLWGIEKNKRKYPRPLNVGMGDPITSSAYRTRLLAYSGRHSSGSRRHSRSYRTNGSRCIESSSLIRKIRKPRPIVLMHEAGLIAFRKIEPPLVRQNHRSLDLTFRNRPVFLEQPILFFWSD